MFNFPDINQITSSIQVFLQPFLKHESLAIFLILSLGIVALPFLPEESLILTVGFFISKGKLVPPAPIIACYLGAMTGISMSYMVGRSLGHYLLLRYGKWVGLNQKKIDRVEYWFSKIGSWTLLIGYFIPGIRHVTGYMAGTFEIPYFRFACFAYSGAFIWVTTFLSIGYFLGTKITT